jgi:predicted dienelactone hydrolase
VICQLTLWQTTVAITPNHEALFRTVPRAECVLVRGAGHYSFITSFPAALRIVAGEGARDPDRFDRDAFHEVMNREIVEFFDRTLRPAGEALMRDAQPPSCRSR